MVRRSGLGRGLEAIIPAEAAPDDGAVLQEVAVDEIRPNRYQPRHEFDEESLAELAASIRALGLLQPVLVRRQDEGAYELIAGERRWRAARAAGLRTVPALVRSVGDEAALEQAVVENVHRDDLNPLEEAAAYQQLLADFGLTQEAVAARVGKSRSAVANTVRLLQLPAAIQALVASGALATGHARALLGSDDQVFQEELAGKIARAGLTVRQVEEAVRSHNQQDPSDPSTPGQTRPAALLELESLLSERLSTRVHVGLGAKKGRIQIEFADLEDLERIFLLIS